MTTTESDSRRIIYAGEPGAFAEDAVLAAFGDVDRRPVGSFRAVFDEVASGHGAAGVIPIENVIHGTVRENYDLLMEHSLVIQGEVVVPVALCLAALPGQTLDDIERVYSHIQALGQAEAFLRGRPWQLLSTYNTAGAGKAIVDRGERGAAAVLSPRAAGLFGLEILADEIGDLEGNRTRFVVVAPADAAPLPLVADLPMVPRTTIVVAVRNEPGTLLAVLRVIADRALNMRKLESRPMRERPWEYVFWIDLDGDRRRPGDGRRARRGPQGHDDDARARQLSQPGRLGLSRRTPGCVAAAPRSRTRALAPVLAGAALAPRRDERSSVRRAVAHLRDERPATNAWPLTSDRARAGLALRGVGRVRLLAERAGLHLVRRRVLDEREPDPPDDERDDDERDHGVDEQCRTGSRRSSPGRRAACPVSGPTGAG